MKFGKPLKHFVSGGAGLVGSCAVGNLLANGQTVTVYDNISSGRREWLAPYKECVGFRFVEGDMLDTEKLTAVLDGHDVVWHFGANTDISSGYADTEVDLRNCILATRNVLESMRTTGVKQMVFSSSSAVYGEPLVSPTSEAYGPLRPISLYGAAKLANEGQVSAYCHLFGIQAWVFRFANVVGGRMTHGVIHDFIKKLRHNPQELDVLGDGEQEKSYFLVEDCVEAMLCAVEKTNEWFDVFNLGCRSRTKVRRIAQIVIEEMGLEGVEVKYRGGRQGFPGDVPALFLDIDKIEALGWQAKHTSDEAVRIAARRMLGKAALEGSWS
jgi:UDP-glucose 4-epimerase